MPPKATSGKGGNPDGDDQSQVTAATLDTKLSADTLQANQQDDVSVLQEDESVTLGKLEEEGEEEKGGGESDEHDNSDGDGDGSDDEDEEDGEEEKKAEGEGEDADNMSALTANTKNTVPATGSKDDVESKAIKRSFLSKITPGFLKNVPKVTSTRRFQMSAVRRFSLAHKSDVDEETTLEVYEPALRFHERMAKRRENFRTRKERVDETVENAEHKKLNIEDYVSTIGK
mmetsp:Transcript_11989/g.23859  ORF Transcript_11989/g.23859 Transcript_11989/m.23859 type:complete len:230 (-) Transcript_11989:101-790(-)